VNEVLLGMLALYTMPLMLVLRESKLEISANLDSYWPVKTMKMWRTCWMLID